MLAAIVKLHASFQSTLPAWGATQSRWIPSPASSNFNPRSPRGERLYQCIPKGTPRRDFNPRSPRGERQRAFEEQQKAMRISIHAPRVGSDLSLYPSILSMANFNPRSPRGERPHLRFHTMDFEYFNPRSPRGERLSRSIPATSQSSFQSTLPAWGATTCPA